MGPEKIDLISDKTMYLMFPASPFLSPSMSRHLVPFSISSLTLPTSLFRLKCRGTDNQIRASVCSVAAAALTAVAVRDLVPIHYADIVSERTDLT